MDQKYGRRSSKFSASSNLRPRRKRNYRHLFNTIPHKPDTYDFGLEETVMTQFNFKKGLAKFGNKGKEAVMLELKQLHDKCAVEPVRNLSKKQKSEALRYLMYLNMKKTGRLKARGCTDGRKQRSTMSKDEASSPTVAIESVF